MLFAVVHPGAQLRIDVRIVEKPEPELQPQDVADGVVQLLFAYLSVADQVGDVVEIGVRHHVHVDTGRERQSGRIGLVGCEAVRDQLAGGVPVGDDHAVESPLVAQHLLQQPAVGGRGDAVVVVERGHDGHGAAVADRLLEGRQIDVAEQALGDVGRVVVAASLGGSVADEVFGAGGHAGRVADSVALIAPRHGGTHDGRQVGILARTLGDTAPARVAGDVEHRREGPANTGRRSFDGGGAGPLLHELGIECRGLAQRNGEDGLIAVDHVAAYNNRNAQPALLHGVALQLVGDLGREGVQHRADGSAAQDLRHLFGHEIAAQLIRLADLLL